MLLQRELIYKTIGVHANNGLSFGEGLSFVENESLAGTPEMALGKHVPLVSMIHSGPENTGEYIQTSERLANSVSAISSTRDEDANENFPIHNLVVALILTQPKARFCIGLGCQYGAGGLNPQIFGAKGRQALDLRKKDRSDEALELFRYVNENGFWRDDDNVHRFALLTYLADHTRKQLSYSVLGQSIDGNHLPNFDLIVAYQLLESILPEQRNRERWLDRVDHWNDSSDVQIDSSIAQFIKARRDKSMHFTVDDAEKKLRQAEEELGFDTEPSKKRAFLELELQETLRRLCREYFLGRIADG